MLEEKDLAEFVQKALAADGAFSIQDAPFDPKWFISTKVGNARFIYECRMDAGPEDGMPGEEACLIAVVADKVVYLEHYICLRALSGLPKGAASMQALAPKLNEAAWPIIHKFYDTLEPARQQDSPKHQLKNLERDARRCALGIASLTEFSKPSFKEAPFQTRTAIAVLAGRTDVQTVALEYCKRHAGQMSNAKGYAEAVEKRMSDPKLTEPWERELAKSLVGLTAKNITVEFSKNGKVRAGKMSRITVLEALVDKDRFGGWSFLESYSRSEELVNDLCPAGNDRQQLLFCSDISRILFRGNIVYEQIKVGL